MEKQAFNSFCEVCGETLTTGDGTWVDMGSYELLVCSDCNNKSKGE
jgi:ribosome-binding protein aMBF1 (putative translation factor)